MASKRKRIVRRRLRDGSWSERWYAKRWNGKRKALACTGTSDAKAANEIARAWENEDARRRAGVQEHRGVDRCSLSDAIDHKIAYDVQRVRDGQLSRRTLRGYLEKCRRLLEHWSDVDINTITANDVDDWIARRLRQVSRAEVHKEKQQLGHVLKVCKRAGLWSGELSAIMPTDWKTGAKPDDRWMPMAELLVLLAALPPHRAAVVAFAAAFGANPAVAKRARWEDFSGGYMLLRDHKNAHRWRRVRVMVHLAHLAHGALWWLSQSGTFKQWLESNTSRDLRAACKSAGVRYVPLKNMRHSFCHYCLIAKVPERDVARYMGHTSDAMVRRVYGRANSGEALAELLGDHVL